MPAPPRHDPAVCPGDLARVYERPGRSLALRPLGYVCTICRTFVPDEDTEMPSISDLRPAVEAVAQELIALLWDRRVNERVAGIVRANPDLLASAQSGNPYLTGTRRWWSISTALVLRRHIDAGFPRTLRWIVEHLAALEGRTSLTSVGSFKGDLERLEALSVRFRPYFNAIIHGGGTGISSPAAVTFNDLLEALDVVRDVGQRAYSAITNVSYSLEAVEQFEWTEIFKQPWIEPHVELAYELGEPGVPYDAVPLTKIESTKGARLIVEFQKSRKAGELIIEVSNDTRTDALDVRIFVPHLSTAVDAPEIVGEGLQRFVVPWLDDGDPRFGHGQAVIEFSDIHDNVYRQYADVDVRGARVRRLSPVPFRVQGRIVAPSSFVHA